MYVGAEADLGNGNLIQPEVSGMMNWMGGDTCMILGGWVTILTGLMSGPASVSVKDPGTVSLALTVFLISR